MRSSQSRWYLDVCQELEILWSNQTKSRSNTNTNNFMPEEWIVIHCQSASEVNYYLI